MKLKQNDRNFLNISFLHERLTLNNCRVQVNILILHYLR